MGLGEAQPCKGPRTVGVWLSRVDHAVEQAAVPVLLQVTHLQESTPECPPPNWHPTAGVSTETPTK